VSDEPKTEASTAPESKVTIPEDLELELRSRITRLEHKHDQAADAIMALAGAIAILAIIMAIGAIVVYRRKAAAS
jgi:hypothetical protein